MLSAADEDVQIHSSEELEFDHIRRARKFYLGGDACCRMFPFQRGLLHAYWAPNFWALYAAVDKALEIALQVSGRLNRQGPGTASGLVQETVFRVLPQVCY